MKVKLRKFVKKGLHQKEIEKGSSQHLELDETPCHVKSGGRKKWWAVRGGGKG